jgi:molybdopterin converting factor small subunit
MAHVTLIGNLRQFTGGVTELDLEAANVRQLFAKLGEKYPELAPHLETGSAVAIDGQIYQDALFAPIQDDSEVFLLPQIAGGRRPGPRGPTAAAGCPRPKLCG